MSDDDGRSGGTASPERSVSDDESGTAQAASTENRGALDSTAETFLAVERRLVSAEGPWRAVAVDVVTTSEVPGSYPREIETAEALELTLRSPEDRSEEPVYLPFPEDGVVGAESDLGRLLAALDVPADRFGDLHGKRIPVEREDGALVVSDPDRRTRRGSDRAIYGVLAAYGGLLAAAAVTLFGGGSLLASPASLVVLGLLNVVVLPVATYLDGWHLRSTGDWGHAPGLWALLAVLPAVNLVSTALYLLVRPR